MARKNQLCKRICQKAEHKNPVFWVEVLGPTNWNAYQILTFIFHPDFLNWEPANRLFKAQGQQFYDVWQMSCKLRVSKWNLCWVIKTSSMEVSWRVWQWCKNLQGAAVQKRHQTSKHLMVICGACCGLPHCKLVSKSVSSKKVKRDLITLWNHQTVWSTCSFSYPLLHGWWFCFFVFLNCTDLSPTHIACCFVGTISPHLRVVHDKTVLLSLWTQMNVSQNGKRAWILEQFSLCNCWEFFHKCDLGTT